MYSIYLNILKYNFLRIFSVERVCTNIIYCNTLIIICLSWRHFTALRPWRKFHKDKPFKFYSKILHHKDEINRTFRCTSTTIYIFVKIWHSVGKRIMRSERQQKLGIYWQCGYCHWFYKVEWHGFIVTDLLKNYILSYDDLIGEILNMS